MTHPTGTYLIEELFACGVWLDGKLQLRIHRSNPDIDLQKKVGGRKTVLYWPQS